MMKKMMMKMTMVEIKQIPEQQVDGADHDGE